MKLIKPITVQHMLEIRKMYVERAEWLRTKGIAQWGDVDTRYSVERLCTLAVEGTLYALEHEGKILAAAAVFSKDKMWENTNFALKNVLYVHGLVSVKNHTLGAQIANPGKMMLKMIEAKALLADKTHVALDCRKENTPLVNFYEENGYTERFEKTYSTGAKASLRAKYLRG